MGFPNIWNLIPRPNLIHLVTYICECVCVCTHVRGRIYIRTHAHMYGCTHTHVCIHVCAYIQLIVSHCYRSTDIRIIYRHITKILIRLVDIQFSNLQLNDLWWWSLFVWNVSFFNHPNSLYNGDNDILIWMLPNWNISIINDRCYKENSTSLRVVLYKIRIFFWFKFKQRLKTYNPIYVRPSLRTTKAPPF